MKKFAAAKRQSILQRVDNFLEAVRSEWSAVEQEQRKLAQHVAGGVTRKHGMVLHFRENVLRVVVKNNLQQVRQRTPIPRVRTEERRGALAPRELRGRGVTGEPSLLAENFGHVAASEGSRGSGWNRIRRFSRSHRGILACVSVPAGPGALIIFARGWLPRAQRWLRRGRWRPPLRWFWLSDECGRRRRRARERGPRAFSESAGPASAFR